MASRASTISLDRRKQAPLRPAVEAGKHPWSWTHLFAAVGIPFLIWETWTLVAWLRDGPRLVTEFQDRGSANWYGALVFQVGIVIVALAVGTVVVRNCRRERKIFTFDVCFLLAGMTIFWADFATNFFMPTLVGTSNFLAFNNPCGHMPFVVNPDCGRAPDAIPFWILAESFGVLGGAMVMGAIVRWIRGRWPNARTLTLVAAVLLLGVKIDVILEFPAVALGLWTYLSPPELSIPLGGGYRYAVTEFFAGGVFFGVLAAIRIFKNDRGLSIVEQGLDHLRPKSRVAVRLLAMYGFFQLAIWLIASVPTMLYGPYMRGYPDLPRYVVNNTCDAPGIHGTRYGPCPGAPGYRMPGRHSLPGESP